MLQAKAMAVRKDIFSDKAFQLAGIEPLKTQDEQAASVLAASYNAHLRSIIIDPDLLDGPQGTQPTPAVIADPVQAGGAVPMALDSAGVNEQPLSQRPILPVLRPVRPPPIAEGAFCVTCKGGFTASPMSERYPITCADCRKMYHHYIKGCRPAAGDARVTIHWRCGCQK